MKSWSSNWIGELLSVYCFEHHAVIFVDVMYAVWCMLFCAHSAKIVLNLRHWGLPGEWKISRLAPLLARGRYDVIDIVFV